MCQMLSTRFKCGCITCLSFGKIKNNLAMMSMSTLGPKVESGKGSNEVRSTLYDFLEREERVPGVLGCSRAQPMPPVPWVREKMVDVLFWNTYIHTFISPKVYIYKNTNTITVKRVVEDVMHFGI